MYLTWLNENNDDYHESITKLKQVINTIETFTDIDECIDFITDRPDQVTYMVTSEVCAQRLRSIVADISQLKSIYIFCKNPRSDTNIESICEALKQTLKDDDRNEISISFANNNILDCSFMYTQILKEILLTIDFNEQNFKDFLTFCRTEFAQDTRELRKIDRLENEYHQRKPIWWYTWESFLYKTLNKALRLMDVDIIIKMGFFICDLHKQIADLHIKQISAEPFTVYRLQGLSRTDFTQMKENRNGLLAFNNFLSTSKNRQVSLKFLHRIRSNNDLIPVLFVISIDPSIKQTPFANVTDFSAVKNEEEILFSMHSVFRIGQINKKLHNNDQIWQVELTLTSDSDPELHILTEHMRNTTLGVTSWNRLGSLMIELSKFDKAEEIYELLLREAKHPSEKACVFHQFGVISYGQAKYEQAIQYYQKSLEMQKQIPLTDHSLLAASFHNIGTVYMKTNEHSKALEYYKKALEILSRSVPVDHKSLASTYHNIGNVYNDTSDYSQALQYFQKSLEIREKILPANHPSLAASYNSIGFIYSKVNEYLKALEYYEKSLEIERKTLPADHPDLATSYNNIGSVYDNINEYSKALEYYQKSLEIREKRLSSNHPDLAISYSKIGFVYEITGKYSQALECYEKSLEIRRKILPADHPNLATTYNNIGSAYRSMSEYSNALQYFRKSLEIGEKTLPENHPDLAISYNNIGIVYNSKKDYRRALEYLEQALRIWRKSLPANHPNIKKVQNSIVAVKQNL